MDYAIIISGLSLIVILIVFILSFGVSFLRGAPFAPTPKQGVTKIIELAKIKKGSKAADLGSGDGRIVIALAKAGAEAHGYEINRTLVRLSRIKINMASVSDKAFIHCQNFWKVNFSDYDIIIIFGIPHIMKKLEEKLMKETSAPVTIVCNNFSFPNWKPSYKGGKFYVYEK